MKINLTYLVICIFILCSCASGIGRHSEVEISVNLNGGEGINVPLRQSDFIDSVAYIKVSNDLVLGEIRSIKYCNGYYYLHDADANAIWIITEQGEMYSKICHYGRAKDEYLSLFKFEVNPRNGQVYIYDQMGEKMLRYSRAGELLGGFRIDRNKEIYRDFAVLSNGNILCCDLLYYDDFPMRRGVWLTDSTGTFLKYLYQPDISIKQDMLFLNYFWRIDSTTVGMRAELGNDTLYHCNNDGCRAQFVIKPDRSYDRSWLKTNDISREFPDGFYAITSYVETCQFLYFTMSVHSEEDMQSGHTSVVFYDKQSQNPHIAKKEDDIIIDMNFLGIMGSTEDRLLCVFNPSGLPENYQKMFPELEGCNQSVIQVAYLKQ